MSKQITFLVIMFFFLAGTSQTDSAAKAFYPDSVSVFQIPLFNTGAEEGEAGFEQQDISGLLQASRDIFSQFASFQFGQARFRMRGYGTGHHQVLLNGVDLSNPETGISSWSTWGGLNDVTRFVESRFGNTASRYNFSGKAGYTNIDSKASSFKKFTRCSYTSSGRIYRHRLMFTQSSGMNRRGWAFTGSGSFRSGDELQVPGTYFSAWALYTSIDKKINHQHLLSLSAFVAPVEQGRRNSAVMEAYQLTNNNFYNSAWGWQNGKIRNAAVSSVSKPTLMLIHNFTPDQQTKLSSSLSFQAGKSGITGLNYSDATSPRPDYYKYLPSYSFLMGDSSTGDMTSISWETNPAAAQVNWDELIAVNKANLYSTNADQAVNTTETRARYLLEKREEAQKQLVANIIYNKRKNRTFISAGFNARWFSARKYKVAEDLLGATFWLDVDQFAEELGVEDQFRQNDIDKPNRKVRTGERFGYDYTINIQRAESWMQAEYNLKKTDLYFGGSLSVTNAWRTGHIANGKFPHSSKGESENLLMAGQGLKAGATYKLSGRQYLSFNGTWQRRPPPVSGIFISPASRNTLVEDLKQEEIRGGDLNYNIRNPYFKLRLSLFISEVKDQLWLRSFWHDGYNTFVNMVMKNVRTSYQGVEFAVEKNISGRHFFQFAFGLSEALYKGRPGLEAWQDNNNNALFTNEEVYLKNYRSNSAPQLATGAGYRIAGKNFWFLALAVNFFDHQYVEVNPLKRTSQEASRFLSTEADQYLEIVRQQKLPSYFITNLSGGKSFRLRHKLYLNLNLSINNLFNNTTAVVSGFEQLRYNPAYPSLFPPKYLFLTGRSYMLITTISF